MTQSVSLDAFPGALAAFARVFPEVAIRVLRQTARESRAIIVDVARKTTPYSPIDTGAYLRAWAGVPHEEGADIVNDTAYASTIEEGRPPGTHSPVAELTEWVIRKSRGPWNDVAAFVAPDPLGFKSDIRAVRRQFRKKAERAQRDLNIRGIATRAAIIISRNHFKRGMKPRFVFASSWPAILRLLDANLEEALRREAGRNWGV